MWGADITPEDDARRGGARVRGEARQGRRVHRPRRAAARPARARPSGGSRASCSPIRGRCARGGAGAGDGEIAGRVTSGGYGFAVGGSIAYAYVPAAAAEVGRAVEVEVFGEWVGGRGGGRAAVGPGGRAHPLVGQARGLKLAHDDRLVAASAGADDRDRHADLGLDELEVGLGGCRQGVVGGHRRDVAAPPVELLVDRRRVVEVGLVRGEVGRQACRRRGGRRCTPGSSRASRGRRAWSGRARSGR